MAIDYQSLLLTQAKNGSRSIISQSSSMNKIDSEQKVLCTKPTTLTSGAAEGMVTEAMIWANIFS